jgi:hypothetical protein
MVSMPLVHILVHLSDLSSEVHKSSPLDETVHQSSVQLDSSARLLDP